MMNLLQEALTVIPPQKVFYTAVIGEEVLSNGVVSNVEAPRKKLFGSFQPVDRKLYSVNGLDFQKRYYTFFTSQNAFDLYRDENGDFLQYDGREFKIESRNADWYAYDGWDAVLCVQIS